MCRADPDPVIHPYLLQQLATTTVLFGLLAPVKACPTLQGPPCGSCFIFSPALTQLVVLYIPDRCICRAADD